MMDDRDSGPSSTSSGGPSSTAEVAPPPTEGHAPTAGGAATVALSQAGEAAPTPDLTAADTDSPSWPPPRVPRFLGEYEIEGVIAQGGMGVVYRARQVKLNNRPVALKLIRDPALARPSDIRRFLAEAEVVAELDHPNIVPIYQVDQVDGQPFFSMRLIEGGNLAKHLHTLKADPRRAAALMAKVARAVQYAHQRAILHRDIKPSNILVDADGTPYVTDFGLAKRIVEDADASGPTLSGAVMGTPAYMPPEQARGDVKGLTTAVDVYALGATLFEALTGRPPFQGGSPAEVLRQVLDQEPPKPRDLSPWVDRDLETICLKCLEKDPGRRYATAQELAEDLEAWLEHRPITARPVTNRERLVKWARRRPAIAGLTAFSIVALLGLIIGGGYFTWRLGRLLDLANRGRYAADSALMRRAMDDHQIDRVRELLDDYRPGRTGSSDYRGFEWFYFWRQCDPETKRLEGGGGPVAALAYAPDGRSIATADGRAIRLWDPRTGQLRRVLPRSPRAIALAFSPDGTRLAASFEGGIGLWDVQSGEPSGHLDRSTLVRSLAWHPDGRHLACGTFFGGLFLCDTVGTAPEIVNEYLVENRSPEAPVSPIFALAYSNDGAKLFASALDPGLMVWDVAASRQERVLPHVAGPVNLALSRDGRRLIVAGQNGVLEAWDVATYTRTRVFGNGRAHGAEAYGIAISPDGQRVVAAGNEPQVLYFDLETGRAIDRFLLPSGRSPQCVAFSPDGRQLALIDREAVVVRRAVSGPEPPRTIDTNQGKLEALALSSDGRWLAAAAEGGRLAAWDLRDGRQLPPPPRHALAAFDVAVGPDGLMASVGGDGKVLLTDLPSARSRGSATAPGVLYSVAVRPDGRQVAAGGADGTIRLWETSSLAAPQVVTGHQGSVLDLAYDRSGRTLVSAGADGTVRVWSSSSGASRRPPIKASSSNRAIAISPDGSLIAAGGDLGGDGELTIWDATLGLERVRITGLAAVEALAFSPDGRRLASGAATAMVQIWDVASGRETLALAGHADRVTGVAFDPRGLNLYSAGWDGIVRAWDGNDPGAVPGADQ